MLSTCQTTSLDFVQQGSSSHQGLNKTRPIFKRSLKTGGKWTFLLLQLERIWIQFCCLWWIDTLLSCGPCLATWVWLKTRNLSSLWRWVKMWNAIRPDSISSLKERKGKFLLLWYRNEAFSCSRQIKAITKLQIWIWICHQSCLICHQSCLWEFCPEYHLE